MNLRDACAQKHKIAENMPFNVNLVKGKLSESEYLLYLVQLLEIFSSIENIGLPSPTLARKLAVEADIAELINKGNSAGEVLPSTKEYTIHLQNLDNQTILPHVYVNYLALMFGGQIMKSKVPSSGKIYEFEDMRAAMQAVRNVQKDEWADEANLAYSFIIRIFDDLEKNTAK